MEQGVFNRLNAALFMVQDDAVLRRIMDPLFSIHYDMTLKQALMDFYQLKNTSCSSRIMLIPCRIRERNRRS